MSQCALRWVLDDGLVDTIIIGAKNPDQVISNFDILSWQMEVEDVKKLSQVE
jgi:aryl-alcohol dehydrogenase-like predicted oxidoreductase